MQINLSTYKIFRDLVNTQSFSKAATLNSITQSAVSQQIAGLEKRLECPLIERGKKELGLTREGRRFFQVCYDIIDIQDRFLREIKELNNQITGVLNVSTIYSIGLHDLPPYLKKFIKQFPGIHVHVEYRRSHQVYEDIQKNVSDLGFIAFPEKKSQFVIKPFKRDRLVLICHPSHRLANFKAVSIKQLIGQKFIGFDPDAPTKKALEGILKKHRIEVEHIMEFDNIETLKRAVEIDMGVSLVPLSTVTQEVKNRTLKSVDFADQEFFRPLHRENASDNDGSSRHTARRACRRRCRRIRSGSKTPRSGRPRNADRANSGSRCRSGCPHRRPVPDAERCANQRARGRRRCCRPRCSKRRPPVSLRGRVSEPRRRNRGPPANDARGRSARDKAQGRHANCRTPSAIASAPLPRSRQTAVPPIVRGTYCPNRECACRPGISGSNAPTSLSGATRREGLVSHGRELTFLTFDAGALI